MSHQQSGSAVPPTAISSEEARNLLQAIRAAPDGVVLQAGGRHVRLPEALTRLLERAVGVLAGGQGVELVEIGRELSPADAAKLLNVSRESARQLMLSGEIPSHTVGTHRRAKLEDVLAYKRRRDEDRTAALDELTALSQEAGGYPELK